MILSNFLHIFQAVVNEDFHGNNQKLQNEIRRLKEIVESLQNNSVSPSSALGLLLLLDKGMHLFNFFSFHEIILYMF